MVSLNLLERRHGDGNDYGDCQPRQNDEHRETMDCPRNSWSRDVLLVYLLIAHADFSRQEVKAFTWLETFSVLTLPSTRMRHPMSSLSPCATTLPTAAEFALIAKSNDHGRLTP